MSRAYLPSIVNLSQYGDVDREAARVGRASANACRTSGQSTDLPGREGGRVKAPAKCGKALMSKQKRAAAGCLTSGKGLYSDDTARARRGTMRRGLVPYK